MIKTDNFQINYNSEEEIRPIQLISFNENKGFLSFYQYVTLFFLEIQINQEAIDFFEKLKEENFATISVVGKYRTGKSYLLNRVLLDQSDGFSVGPTINPCTKVINPFF